MGPLTARTLRTQVGDSRWAATDVDVAHPLGVQRTAKEGLLGVREWEWAAVV